MVSDISKELEILIRSTADLSGFQELRKAVTKTSSEIQANQKFISELTSGLGKLGAEVSSTGRSFRMAGETGWRPLIRDGQLVHKNVQLVSSGLAKVSQDAQKTAVAMKAPHMSFQMWALGILFGSMMIQRSLQQILVAGTTTFMRLTEGQGQAAMGITALSAEWTLLKFSIGNAIATALLPLIPTLVNIIEKVSNWIQQNPKLVSGFLIWGIALAAVLTIVGQGILYIESIINGIKALWFVLMLFSKTSFFAGLISSLKHLIFVWIPGLLVALGPITLALLTILAVAAIFASKWDLNWKTITAVLAISGLTILKVISKISAGLVGFFDIGLNTVRDLFSRFFNWVIEKWNSFISVLANNKLVGRLGLSNLIKSAQIDFRFDTNNGSEAIDRFNAVQQGIESSFSSKIGEWKDVLEEWKNHKDLSSGMQEDMNQMALQDLEFTSQKLTLETDLNAELEKRIGLLEQINLKQEEGSDAVFEAYRQFKARSSSSTI